MTRKPKPQVGRFRFRTRTRAELAMTLRRDGVVDAASIGSTLFVQSTTTLYVMHASLIETPSRSPDRQLQLEVTPAVLWQTPRNLPSSLDEETCGP